MPGWQIALIALAAAVAAAILAVLLDHAWVARRAHSARAWPSPPDQTTDQATDQATESQSTGYRR
jgi:hypothetical protein